MDEFMNGFGSINTFYIKDSEGGLIKLVNGAGIAQDIKIERVDGKMDKIKEEMLIELHEKLEVMNNAISDVQYLVDAAMHDGEMDRNLDLKMIIKLNRIEDELEQCYDIMVEDSL